MESEHSDKLAEVIGEWQTRLLQLDRRNNLLYFKPKRSAIRIIDTSPDKISEDLITSRGGLSFDYAEPRTRGARDVDTDEDQEEEAEPYVIPGDIRAEPPRSTFSVGSETYAERTRNGKPSRGSMSYF